MRYALLSMLCLATVIAYLQRSALGVPSKKIEADLGMDPGELGLVWLGWYIAYAVCQLPSGWLADRLGSKAALILYMLLWSGVTAAVGAATGFVGLLALWSLMGCAQAGIFPCASKAIAATFPRTEHAFASGCLACSMAFGAALAQRLTGELFGPIGWTWQNILLVYALPGAAWAVAFAVLIPRPDAPRPAADVSKPSVPFEWTKLFTDPQMLLLCVQQFLRAAAVALLFTWFPRFLQETKGLSPEESGRLAAWPLIAGMAGGLVGGLLSDWLLRRTERPRLSRQGLSFVSMLVCVGESLGAYFAERAETVVLFVGVATFFAYIGGLSAYAMAMTMGGSRVTPVFATMNMWGNVGSGLFPFAVGSLVKITGNWNLTLLLFASLFAGSAVCWAVLNPKGPLFDEHSDHPR